MHFERSHRPRSKPLFALEGIRVRAPSLTSAAGPALAHAPPNIGGTCQGPWSSECGGPVVAGAFDGSCSAQEGGLGMYQLDSGTYSQTLATYGSQVLTVSGNASAGINVIIEKIRSCPNTPSFGTTADVISWINSATPGTANYDTFMAAMAWCYNGCPPGVAWCDHSAVKSSYTNATQTLLNTFGWSYWYGGGTTTPPGQATGLWPDNWADAGSSSVALTWSAVSGATSYDVLIYYWNGSAWTYYYTYTTSSASMTFWPQFHNSYCAWAVTAKNSAGAGPVSSWAYFYFR